MKIKTISLAKLAPLALIFSAPVVANDDVAEALKYGMPAVAGAVTYLKDDTEGMKQFAYAFGGSILTTYALKSAIDKERPDGSDNDAFPSGHTTSAFASAAFLHRRYGATYGVPAYALATYVAYSRVDNDHHEWEDVAAGAAIGIGFNYWLTTKYQAKGVDLAIAPTNGGAVVSFNASF